MNDTNLDKEVREFYDSVIDLNGDMSNSWIVTSIVRKHSSIAGEDRGWYEDCAMLAVWDAVNRHVRRMKASEEAPGVEQAELFPGYKRLQRRYVVNRHGEQKIVLVENLTDDEIDAKIQEHEVQSAGHLLHAEELRRFKSERRQSA